MLAAKEPKKALKKESCSQKKSPVKDAYTSPANT
jgi:hypothetical protein